MLYVKTCCHPIYLHLFSRVENILNLQVNKARRSPEGERDTLFFPLSPNSHTTPANKKNPPPPKSTEHYWPRFSRSVLETARRYTTLLGLVCKFCIFINSNSYRLKLFISRNFLQCCSSILRHITILIFFCK